MQALKSAGWHAVTLDQVAAHWKSGAPLGAGKPIVLTFDNGYQSQFTQALPVIRRLGWVAEENTHQLTDLPPLPGWARTSLGPPGPLAAGWELDTQGFSHADLIALDAQQLHYEVATARTVLQQRYHVPVNWFCYPSGHYDATVLAAVKAAGYTGSTTVVPGWAHRRDDPYRLPRLRVLGGTTPAQLLGLIAKHGRATQRHPPCKGDRDTIPLAPAPAGDAELAVRRARRAPLASAAACASSGDRPAPARYPAWRHRCAHRAARTARARATGRFPAPSALRRSLPYGCRAASGGRFGRRRQAKPRQERPRAPDIAGSPPLFRLGWRSGYSAKPHPNS